MKIVYSGSELHILENEGIVSFIDNDLKTHGGEFDTTIELHNETDLAKGFVNAVLEYFKDTPYPQFRVVELKMFARWFKKEFVNAKNVDINLDQW